MPGNINPPKAIDAVYAYLMDVGPVASSRTKIGNNIFFSHGAVESAIARLAIQERIILVKLSKHRFLYMALPINRAKYLPKLKMALADCEHRISRARSEDIRRQYVDGMAQLKETIKMVENGGKRAEQIVRELGYE